MVLYIGSRTPDSCRIFVRLVLGAVVSVGEGVYRDGTLRSCKDAGFVDSCGFLWISVAFWSLLQREMLGELIILTGCHVLLNQTTRTCCVGMVVLSTSVARVWLSAGPAPSRAARPSELCRASSWQHSSSQQIAFIL